MHELPLPPEIREAMNLVFQTDEQRQMFVRGYERIIAGAGPLPTVEQLMRYMRFIVAYADPPDDIDMPLTEAQVAEAVRFCMLPSL